MFYDEKPSGESGKHRSLDDWNKHFGGEEGVDPFANDRGKKGFDWELDVAYYFKIKSASLVRSQRGDEQLRIVGSPLGHESDDAPELGEVMEHVTFPWQESDKGMARDLRERVLRMRVDTLKRILGAVSPSSYLPYDKTQAEPGTNKKIYLDFDGTPLTGSRYEERQQAINERTMEWLDDKKERIATTGGEVEELANTYLYVSKKRNLRNENYPYTNWHATRPSKLRIFSGDAGHGQDEETPF